MALVNSQKNTTVPPELQPYYDGNSGSNRGHIIRWIIRIVLLIIIIVLIIMGIVWLIHRHDKLNSSTNKPTGTSQNQLKQKATSSTNNGSAANNSGTVNGSNSSSSSSGSSSSASSTPNTTQTSSTGAETIPNTGPGQTISLFVTVALAGTAAYQIRLRKKLARFE